jgi:predicted transcriptional regulator
VKKISFAGTATDTIRSLNISVGPKTSTGKRKNQMSNTLDPHEIRGGCPHGGPSLMVDHNFHTIPVVDEGELVGIVGKEDMLRTLMPISEAE